MVRDGQRTVLEGAGQLSSRLPWWRRLRSSQRLAGGRGRALDRVPIEMRRHALRLVAEGEALRGARLRRARPRRVTNTRDCSLLGVKASAFVWSAEAPFTMITSKWVSARRPPIAQAT